MRKFTFGLLLSLFLAACGVNDPFEVATPELIAMYPEPGSAEVSVVTNVWATFDAAVDTDWATGSFTLTDADGVVNVVDVDYDQASHTVTLTPAAPLSYDTVYEAGFTAHVGVQSSVGSLSEDVAWTFSTEPSPAGGTDGEDAGEGAGGDTSGGTGEDAGEGAGGDASGDTRGDTSGDTGVEPGQAAGGTGHDGTGDPIDTCDGDECTYANVTLTDPIVPANATWTLENVTINGALEIGAGAIVHATNLLVNGKLEATGAKDLVFAGSTVTGKVELKHGGAVHLTTTAIGAHLELIGNDGTVVAGSNDVQTNLYVYDNTGSVELVGNHAGGDLYCSGNEPAPTGSGNSADGAVSGQCLTL